MLDILTTPMATPATVALAFQKVPGRFIEQVKFNRAGCWEWLGCLDDDGYGVAGNARAHRRFYEAVIGPIPSGKVIDHLCRVRHCVNPAHLEPVTIAENNARGEGLTAVNAGKSECMHGHPFDAINTYIYTRKTGETERGCKECRRAHVRRNRAKTATTAKEGRS